MVARRVRQLAGVEARIGALRYELLSSRFVGSDIEVGPGRQPLLRIGDLTLELSLLSAGGVLKVQRLEATGLQARLPGAWLARAIALRPHRAALVRSGTVTGEVHLVGDAGTAVLSGVEIGVRDLELPEAAEGDRFHAGGQVTLRARRLTLGRLTLERLLLEGRFRDSRLVIERVQAEVLGGKLDLHGRLGLTGARPGPLELRGALTLRPGDGAPLVGKIRLSGRTLAALKLEGSLRGPSPAPASGGLVPAPNVRVLLRLGRRQLQGTASSWQVR